MRIAGFVISAAFALAAYAGNASAAVPVEVFAHVAIRSPGELVQAAGEVAAVLTAGSKKAVTAEQASAMAKFALPIPVDELTAGEDVHLLFLAAGRERHAILLRVDEYDSFFKALRERGAAAPDDSGEPSDSEVVLRVDSLFPGAEIRYRATRLDGGAVLLVSGMPGDEELFKGLLARWTPERGDGDIVAALSLPESWAFEWGRWAQYYGMFAALADRLAIDDVRENLARAGMDAEKTAKMVRAAEAGAADALAGLSEVRDLRVEISASSDVIAVRALFAAREGSALAGIAAGLGHENPSYPVFSFPEEGAAIYAVLPPPSRLFPDAGAIAAEMAESVTEELEDGSGSAVGRDAAAFVAEMGEIAMAAYVRDYKPHWVVWMRAKDPQSAVDSVMRMVRGVDALYTGLFLDGMPLVAFEYGDGVVDGVRYVRSLASIPRRKEWFEYLGGMKKTSPMVTDLVHDCFFKPLERLSLLAAAKGEYAVIVSGAGAEERDLLRALRAVDGPARPMNASASAMEILDRTPDRQIASVLTDGDAYLLWTMLNERSIFPSSNPLGNIVNLALRNALLDSHPEFSAIGGTVGVGLGVRDGGLAFDLAVPVSMLNGELRNQEIYAQAYDAEYRRLLDAYDAGFELEQVE